MEQRLLEHLLNEDEGVSLDFKRDQYPFENASDEQKSELLKDVLAFANAWRRTDAYILVGVEEVKGARSRPVGVSQHLEDGRLQQFVNQKTNRKIDFRYEAVRVDRFAVGVIHIPVQDRPSFLNRDFGKLKANTVYIRSGSSTAIAKPDEIATMGARDHVLLPNLKLAARVLGQRGLSLLLAIENLGGSGPARAPRLLIEPRGPWVQDPYGVDGNGHFGLPRIAKGSDTPGFLYGGDTGTIIGAGISHDVTCIEYKGAWDKRPEALIIDYELTAEGIEPTRSTLVVQL